MKYQRSSLQAAGHHRLRRADGGGGGVCGAYVRDLRQRRAREPPAPVAAESPSHRHRRGTDGKWYLYTAVGREHEALRTSALWRGRGADGVSVSVTVLRPAPFVHMGQDETLGFLYIICHQKLFDGYITDFTLLNIDYVASKQSKDLRDFLQIINQTFTVIGADNKMFDRVLNTDHHDLEDTIQYLCAEANRCDIIVSNDQKFYQGEIEVLNSVMFVKDYLD